MARAAASDDLRQALESHLEETRGHVTRLEQVFESIEEKARGKHCEGMAGIIEEGKSVLDEDFDETTMDACIIASGQRAEHYEMAAYGTLVAWARVMGHEDAANLLQETLDEEKAADEALSALAEGGINQEAADAAHPGDEDEEKEDAEEEPQMAAAAAGRAKAKTAKAGRSNGGGSNRGR
jgi:ferritin-like metal-binding protein YciE